MEMKKLSKEQEDVLVNCGTEEPFSSPLLKEKRDGIFACVQCGNELFDSSTKFDSGTGWPSFYDLKKNTAVNLKNDFSLGLPRTEVVCSKCGVHLGHLFHDAFNQPTGKRYCINGVALDFKKK